MLNTFCDAGPLEYLANWFDNAEDARSVLKFVY